MTGETDLITHTAYMGNWGSRVVVAHALRLVRFDSLMRHLTLDAYLCYSA